MKDNQDAVEPILYHAWLRDFCADKQLVGAIDPSDAFSIHSISRYVDQMDGLWEIGQTYTGRVVTRSGRMQDLDLEVCWTRWETMHHVITGARSES